MIDKVISNCPFGDPKALRRFFNRIGANLVTQESAQGLNGAKELGGERPLHLLARGEHSGNWEPSILKVRRKGVAKDARCFESPPGAGSLLKKQSQFSVIPYRQTDWRITTASSSRSKVLWRNGQKLPQNVILNVLVCKPTPFSKRGSDPVTACPGRLGSNVVGKRNWIR